MAKRIIALVALAVVLVIDYLLALALAQARQHNAVLTVGGQVLLWEFALVNVIFAASLAILFWLVHVWQDRSVALGLIYAAVGLLIVILLPLAGHLRVLRPILASLAWLPERFMPIAGGFILITGLFSLLPRRS